VGGFGHFDEDVVFVEVSLSETARRSLETLVAALRTLPWMAWDPFDAENLHPHMTIAEQCRPRFAEVWDYSSHSSAGSRRGSTTSRSCAKQANGTAWISGPFTGRSSFGP
jgi:2'-5' RNA ligase